MVRSLALSKLPPIFGVSLFFSSVILCRPGFVSQAISPGPRRNHSGHILLYAPLFFPPYPDFLSCEYCAVPASAYGHKKGSLAPHAFSHIRSYAPSLLWCIPFFLLRNPVPGSFSLYFLPFRLRLTGIKRGTLLLNGSVTCVKQAPFHFWSIPLFLLRNPLPGSFFPKIIFGGGSWA